MAFLPKQGYKIPVFDGGLNTKWTDLSCPPHMSPDLLNVDFSDVGAVESANGYEAIGGSLTPTAPVDGMGVLGYNGTELLVINHATNVYTLSSPTDTWTLVSGATGVFTAAVDVCCRTVQDELWMTNGYAVPHRYTGEGFYTVGVSAPVSSCSYAAGIGGSMTTGYRSYYLSGENSNAVESNYGLIAADIWLNVTTGSMSLAGIPVFPESADVRTKYLYRTTAGASGVAYRVTALTANQTAYTDRAADGSIATLGRTDSYPPPHCQYWWYHRGRMFAAGDPANPSRLYYSELGSPEVWPALNFLDVGRGDGMVITGLRVLGNSITVHKTNSDGSVGTVWLIHMPDSLDVTDASNWYIIKSPSSYAARTDKAIDFFENLEAFLDKRGLFAMSGETIAPSPAYAVSGQYLAQSRSENIEPNIAGLHSSLLSKAALIAYDDKLWLAVPEGDSAQHNNVIYVYDYSVSTKERGQGSWYKLDNPPVNNFAIWQGHLVAGSNAELIDGTLPDSVFILDKRESCLATTGGTPSNIHSYFQTVEIAGNERVWEHTKIWRYLWLTVDTPGNWNLTVEWWVDKSQTRAGVASVNLSGGGAEWDSAVLDADTWDSCKDRKTIRVGLGGCVGRTIRFRFSTDNQDIWWAIYRLEVEYNLRSRRN